VSYRKMCKSTARVRRLLYCEASKQLALGRPRQACAPSGPAVRKVMTESGSGGETSSGGSAALPDEWDSDDADAELLALAAAQV